MAEPSTSVRRPPASLQRDWVLCGIAAAASRFLPVPVVDDLVKDRATRAAVARTWRFHHRPPAPDVVATLAGETGGTVATLRRALARLPVTLLLYPWRKLRRLLTAVQGVSGDVVGVVLLARSVDRCLAAGWFATDDEAELQRQARSVRRAHDRALSGSDLTAIRLAVGTAIGQVSGLGRQARRFARTTFAGRAGRVDAGSGQVLDAGTRPGAEVEDGVRRVQAVLDGPQVARLLAELDARFDAALAATAPSRAGRNGRDAR